MKRGIKYGIWSGTVVLLSGSICAVVLGATGLFQQADNTFYPAELEIAVDESGNSGENQTETFSKTLTWVKTESGYSAEKQVAVTNWEKTEDGNYTDAFVRVCLIPRWVQKLQVGTEEIETDVTNSVNLQNFGALTDITIHGNTFTMGEVTFTLDENWSTNWFFNQEDGYFYCKKAVAPGETSPTLLQSVSMTDAAYQTIGQEIQLEIDVAADAVQTVGGAVETLWNNVSLTTDETDGESVLSLKEQTGGEENGGG